MKLIFLLFILICNCGGLENQGNKKSDDKKNEQYRIRQLLCHVPHLRTKSSVRTFNFSRGVKYASSYDSSTAYSTFPNVAFSFDGTITWKYFLVQADPVLTTIWDDSLFYVLATDKFFVSEDAGKTWQSYPLPVANLENKSHYLVFQATGSSSVQLITSHTEGAFTIYSSKNNGRSWTKNSLTGKNLLHYKGETNGIHRVLLSDSFLPSVVKLYISIDDGETWSLKFTFSSGTGTNYMPDYFWFWSDLQGFASGGTSIFRTTDGGTTWTEYAQTFPLQYTSVFYSDGTLLYSSKSSVRRSSSTSPKFRGLFAQSTDNGQTWSSLTTFIDYIEEVYSPSEILGQSLNESFFRTYTSFTNRGTAVKKSSFVKENLTTLWQSDPGWCYFNISITPDSSSSGKSNSRRR